MNTTSSHSSMTFSVNVTAQNVTINPNSIYLYFVTFTLAGDLKFCQSINWTTSNTNLDSAHFPCASTNPPPAGAGGGPPTTPPSVQKTFCGDLICQANGNDYGIQENFYNCPADCPGVNLDTFVGGFWNSFIAYCLDSNPATTCLNPFLNWLPIGKNNIEPAPKGTTVYQQNQVCVNTICQPLSGKTVITNCFDNDPNTPCFWDTSTSMYFLFILLIIFVALSFLRVRAPGKTQKVSPYSYIIIAYKERKKRRKGRKKGRGNPLTEFRVG